MNNIIGERSPSKKAGERGRYRHLELYHSAFRKRSDDLILRYIDCKNRLLDEKSVSTDLPTPFSLSPFACRLTEQSLETYIHNLEQLQQAMLKLGLIEVAAAIETTLRIAGEYKKSLKSKV